MSAAPPPHPSAAAPPPPAAAEALAGAQLPVLARYAELLAGPGVERGLLGPREAGRLWQRHLLNCAAVAPLVPAGKRLLDVGSGAGLPGLVLAILRPDLEVVLVEAMARRTRFLDEVVAALELPRVIVQRARAEDLPAGSADVVTARAVAPLVDLLPLCLPLLGPSGELLALKGASAAAEIAAARPVLQRFAARAHIATMDVPGGASPTTVVRVSVAGRPTAERQRRPRVGRPQARGER